MFLISTLLSLYTSVSCRRAVFLYNHHILVAFSYWVPMEIIVPLGHTLKCNIIDDNVRICCCNISIKMAWQWKYKQIIVCTKKNENIQLQSVHTICNNSLCQLAYLKDYSVSQLVSDNVFTFICVDIIPSVLFHYSRYADQGTSKIV